MTTWAETDNDNGYTEVPGFDASNVILEAPDYASMLKHTSSAQAKEYEQKIQAMLKAGVIGSIRSENYADAATLLHFGPGFAQAMGDVTDVSDKAKKMLDIITAPESPVVVLALTAIPMIMQLMRNHEKEIEVARLTRKDRKRMAKEAKERGETAPTSEKRGFTIRLPFGRTIKVPVSVRFHLVSQGASIFRSQTYAPEDITKKVFEDPKVIAALRKQRIVG